MQIGSLSSLRKQPKKRCLPCDCSNEQLLEVALQSRFFSGHRHLAARPTSDRACDARFRQLFALPSCWCLPGRSYKSKGVLFLGRSSARPLRCLRSCNRGWLRVRKRLRRWRGRAGVRYMVGGRSSRSRAVVSFIDRRPRAGARGGADANDRRAVEICKVVVVEIAAKGGRVLPVVVGHPAVLQEMMGVV